MRGEIVPVKALTSNNNVSVGGTKINYVLAIDENSKPYEMPGKAYPMSSFHIHCLEYSLLTCCWIGRA